LTSPLDPRASRLQTSSPLNPFNSQAALKFRRSLAETRLIKISYNKGCERRESIRSQPFVSSPSKKNRLIRATSYERNNENKAERVNIVLPIAGAIFEFLYIMERR
jgi:hypothetical protein